MVRLDFNMQLELNDQQILEAYKKVLFRSMQKMNELASRKAPVDTGRLKTSINLTPKTPGASNYVLADGVKYGVFQEFGTIKHPAQPFFRPALKEVQMFWAPRYLAAELAKR